MNESDARATKQITLASVAVYGLSSILAVSVARVKSLVQLHVFTTVYQGNSGAVFVPDAPVPSLQLNGFDLFVLSHFIATASSLVFVWLKQYRVWTEAASSAVLATAVYCALGGINETIFFTGGVLAFISTAVTLLARTLLGTPLVFAAHIFTLVLILSQASDSRGPESGVRALMAFTFAAFTCASAALTQFDSRVDLNIAVALASRTSLLWQGWAVYHRYAQLGENAYINTRDVLFIATTLPCSLLAAYLFMRLKKEPEKALVAFLPANCKQPTKAKRDKINKKSKESYSISFSV
jgi:hypothetical protein